MAAPERFVEWLQSYVYADRNKRLPPGLRLQYHSRSDEHSKVLGGLILEDLLDGCDVIREQAARGEVAYGINYAFRWPNGKAKTIDLAIGIPKVQRIPERGIRIRRLRSQALSRRTDEEAFDRLLIACEEKAVMTEHGKSQPRVYSELNDSHTIVHGGSRDTIAAGITMVNVAASFVSPLRQSPSAPVEISRHNQPYVTDSIVKHLQRLPVRNTIDVPGLDAYCTFVVDVDNQGHVALHFAPPAPQPGDPDHYETFLDRICHLYLDRYGDLQNLPADEGLTGEESLIRLAGLYPGLLERVGQMAVAGGLGGGPELKAILQAIERRVSPPRE